METAPLNKTNPLTQKHKKTTYERWQTRRRITFGIVVGVLILAVAIRAYMPIWITDYVNKTLDNIPGYSGSISDVDLALLRGAYVIKDLKLDKDGGDIPVPFLAAKSIDLSLQWSALFRGEVVGDVTIYKPVINFAVGSGGSVQTGTSTDWTVPIKELMPLDINWIEIRDGTIAYQNFAEKEKVDLSIYNLDAKATNLRNIEDKNAALPSTVTARGNSVGKGKLALDGRMNILKPVPDMDVKGKIESINLPSLNDYARSFAAIDFETGTLNVYTDLMVKDGNVTGFVKPLATDISLIDLSKDSNPIGVVWESLVSVVMEVFENQSKDQFATQIPLKGNIKSPNTSFWATLGGVFRNAFVKAYSENFDKE